jgi:protein dispatched 1
MFAIFTVIGIGADNFFVFMDAWRQSAVILPPEMASDKKKRMAYTFRRASRAIAMTSSTTCAAFLANTLSPLMPMKSFGIYAGLIVPINFILVISFFPAAIIILDSNLQYCCSKKNDNNNLKNANDIPKEVIEHEKSWNAKVEKFYETTFSDNVR